MGESFSRTLKRPMKSQSGAPTTTRQGTSKTDCSSGLGEVGPGFHSSRTLIGYLQVGSASFLEGVGQLQHPLLAESGAVDLQANRQALGSLAGRDGDARNAGERSCDRVDVGEIHLQWIGRALAQPEWGHGRGRRDD